MNSIITPLQPREGTGWKKLERPPAWVSAGYDIDAFVHPAMRILVFSAVEVASAGDRIDRGPEYHLSMSKRIADGTRNGIAVRCSSQEAQQVLAEFGLEGSEEDNHVPHGVIRNFWRPVADHLVGIECGCKDEEPAIVEDKGDFIWRGAAR